MWKRLSHTLRCSCLDLDWNTQTLFFSDTHTHTHSIVFSLRNTNKQIHTALLKKNNLIHLCMPWQAEPAVLCWFNTFRGMLTTSSGMLHSQAVDSQSWLQKQGPTEGHCLDYRRLWVGRLCFIYRTCCIIFSVTVFITVSRYWLEPDQCYIFGGFNT